MSSKSEKKREGRVIFPSRRRSVLHTRPVYFIVTEGSKTEPNYLRRLQELCDEQGKQSVLLKVVPSKDAKSSNPRHLIRQMSAYLKSDSGGLTEKDSAWIISDRDVWAEKEFEALRTWLEKLPKQRHVIISNPCFEYWIWLHFRQHKPFVTATECCEALKNIIDYQKNKSFDFITREKVQQASKFAKAGLVKLLELSNVQYNESAELNVLADADRTIDRTATNMFGLIDQVLVQEMS